MLTPKLTYLLPLFLVYCDSIAAQTPQDSLLLRDYTFLKQADPWLTSSNAAALTRFAHQSMAEASLSLNGGKGGFTNYYESPEALQFDGHVESYYRFTPRTVFFGSLSYQNFSGHDMAGSAFIQPERRPFDIVEDSLTNLGTKHRDTYRLTGGFGSTVADGFAVGMKIDYTAANYAKYKDLRHQNKLMDLQLSAGITYNVTDGFTIGANYLYHRNTESITFGTYGTSDKVYRSLISYAAFTGHVEQFGQEGFTDKSREMPLVTDYNGLGAQASFITHHLSFFTSYTYEHGRGYYGRKSPYTITYTNHHSDRHALDVRLDHTLSATSSHRLDFAIDIEQLENLATTYRELQNASSATYYEYYTPTKTADKRWQDYHLGYTLFLGIREALPTWTLQAGMNWMDRRQMAYVYPYYRRQHIHHTAASVAVCRNIIATKAIWSLSLHGSFLQGSGAPYEDLTFQTPSDKQTMPPSMDAWLYREYQYLTAAQYSIGGSVKYTFILPGIRLKPHARLAIDYRKANETSPYSNGCRHTAVTATVGCEF